MKDTIKAEIGYWIGSNEESRKQGYKILLDGLKAVMACKVVPYDEFVYEKAENECFELCEVFTTQKGNQYVYWRDNELDEDYITKIAM